MTAASPPEQVRLPRAGTGPAFSLVARLALRELRAGLGGFRIFVACVALGVAVITTVGVLSDALRGGFASQAESILGGDVTLARMHARATDEMRNWLSRRGSVSESATMRSIGRRPDGTDQALIELKAVDGAYPLVGSVQLGSGRQAAQVVAEPSTAAVDPVLLERLGLKVGDHLQVGEAMLKVADTILSEPDAIVDRLTYGPRVLVSHGTLAATGLLKPGALVRWRYAIKLPERAGDDPKELSAFRERVQTEFPEAGFTLADRRDPSPQVSRTLERLRQFLTLLGLTALIVGGVGVAHAVATFVDKKRKVIAIMRSLGATGGLVFRIFLVQVMAMAALGVLIGLVVGTLVPEALTALAGDSLPIKTELAVSSRSILTAIAYGSLIAIIFTLWPLGRAERIPAGVLFRDDVAPANARPRRGVIAAIGVAVLALATAAVASSDSARIALYFCVGLAVVFALFAGLGTLVSRAARRVRRPAIPEIGLAVASIGAPGGLTRSVVLSLGAGLSLLVAVSLADASLRHELSATLPENSPTYFVLDIAKEDYQGLSQLVAREAPGAHLVEAPMLRGRLLRLGDKSVEGMNVPPEAEWVLTGDRGLTYADKVPEGSRLVAGEWWPEGYDGEPLVSFEADLAQKLGVRIGDTVTVNVLGRNVTARIANLREVKWESLALNFVMVFSPNTLAAAPHAILATITLPRDTPLAEDARLAREIGRAYPGVTPIRVKDAIDAFTVVFSKVMIAVQVAGSVTLLAGALVLAGALATAQRRRILEAVILKTLGATRRRIILAHMTEYGLLALITALIAALVGTIAAWIAVERVMEIAFTFSWTAVAWALALALALVALFGAAGTWVVLGARAVPYLRSE